MSTIKCNNSSRKPKQPDQLTLYKINEREVQEQMHKILPECFPTGKYFTKGKPVGES